MVIETTTYNLTLTAGDPVALTLTATVNQLEITARNGIADAPSDGKQYARKDGAWDEVAASITVDSALSGTSENPVQNKVIKAAIDEIPSVTVDSEVTEESSNPVKSSGIWTWVTGLFTTFSATLKTIATSGLHNDSTSRDAANAHPSSAITNLHEYLADIADCACPISLDSLTFAMDSPTQATITAVATGGVGTLTYTLYDGVTLIEENETGIFVVTEAKTYTVKVNDEVGSTEDSGDVVVNFLDADTSTYLAALSTPLSSAQQIRIDTLVRALKTGLSLTNLSDYFDCFYILANETAEAALKNVAKRAHDITAVNSPTFAQYEGYTGNGTDSYLNSNFLLVTNGVRFKPNDAAIHIYCRTNVDEAKIDFGSRESSTINSTYGVLRLSDQLTVKLQFNSRALTSANTDSMGFYSISRIANNNCFIYKNKALLDTETDTSSSLYDGNMYILAVNNNGSPTLHATKQISVFGLSKGSTQTDINTITDAIEAYMDANGKGVIS